MKRSTKIIVILVVTFVFCLATLAGIIGYVTSLVESRVAAQINQSSFAKVKQVNFSLIGRGLQLVEFELNHPRMQMTAPVIDVGFPFGLGEIIGLAGSRTLNRVYFNLEIDEMKISRIEVTKKKVLENLQGHVKAFVRIRDDDYFFEISSLKIDQSFEANFQIALTAESLNLKLGSLPQAGRLISQRVRTGWANYALKKSSGSLKNEGLSQVVLDILELPQGQLNTILLTAMELFKDGSSGAGFGAGAAGGGATASGGTAVGAGDGSGSRAKPLTPGEELSRQTISSAYAFFNSQKTIGFNVDPPEEIKLGKIVANLQTQLDLGTTAVGLHLWTN